MIAEKRGAKKCHTFRRRLLSFNRRHRAMVDMMTDTVMLDIRYKSLFRQHVLSGYPFMLLPSWFS